MVPLKANIRRRNKEPTKDVTVMRYDINMQSADPRTHGYQPIVSHHCMVLQVKEQLQEDANVPLSQVQRSHEALFTNLDVDAGAEGSDFFVGWKNRELAVPRKHAVRLVTCH